MNETLLVLRGVRRRFGGVQALAGVDLDFRAGEIHALLGENGAGKSTLMHVLAGVLRPDAGTIQLGGRSVSFASPRAARDAGIGMVHQHFTLIEALTVAENLALAFPNPSRWRFDWRATAQQAAALAAHVGFDLSHPEVLVRELPVGARQRLEILKALAGASRVLILDEPTAVLTPQETRAFFAMLRQLRDQGRLIVFITHKLREVKEVADRVTIMRKGRIIGTHATRDISENEMAQHMLGDVVPPRHRAHRAAAGAPVALTVSQVTAGERGNAARLADVSFTVRVGEVFGIAGVDGNGQRELFDVLVGARPPDSGAVSVGGRPLRAFTPAAALAAGIGHIPPDRHQDGLVLALSVQENFLLSRVVLDQVSSHGLLQLKRARRFALDLAEQYAVSFASLDAPVRSLSGGNQQRIVVARELAQRPRVLVAVNPTRGLDVAAAAAVSDAMVAATQRGCAVVLISTDLDEVLDLSDRVSVLSRGRLSTALEPPFDMERLGLLMAGAA